MLRRFTILLVILALLPVLSVAQQKALLKPGGKTVLLDGNQNPDEVLVISPKHQNMSKHYNNIQSRNSILSTNGKIDTLNYNQLVTNWGASTFGGYGQDILVEWFVCPADLKILSVGYDCGDNPSATPGELKLYKIGNGWTVSKIKSITAAKNLGYWIAKGNGFNDIAPFEDEATEPKTWVAHSSEGALSPFVEDLWSDAGTGAPTVPADDGDHSTYQWVSMDLLGFQPELKSGDIFAIVLKNTNTDISVQSGSVIRFGVWSSAEAPSYGMFKYYCGGRTPGDTSTSGWYKREYTMNMVAAVEITGDTPPAISDVTRLRTTLKTDARQVSATITDDNPGGGSAGVASATLKWSIDAGATFTDVAMVKGSGDTYSADIPGQASGSTVAYKIVAVDVNGNSSESALLSYFIFQKANNLLVIYNDQGNLLSKSSVLKYYVGSGTAEPVGADYWGSVSYGGTELADVMQLYNYIVQIDGSYPYYDITSVAKDWLDAATSSNKRAYLLSSQDYGCALTGGNCTDTSFVAGTFQYDYLGVSGIINQDFPGSAKLTIPMQIVGVPNDPVSGWVAKASEDNATTYWYHPYYEISTSFNNYMDDLVPVSGGNATAIFTEPSSGYVVGVRNNGATFNTAYLSHDYLGCNFRSDTTLTEDTDPKYAWGITVKNQVAQFLTWAGYTTGVEGNNNTPKQFSLNQNYPNPFNPITKITYSLPVSGNISLKVFDLLGREVITLANGEKEAGTYEINFDASNLSSGLYFYTLTAGNFTASKKMILLK